METTTKKVLLVDDHSVVIAGAKMLLQFNIPGLEFSEAMDGDTARNLIMAKDFDLLILDVNMPGFHAFGFIEEIKQAKPELRILVFSMNPEESFAHRFIKLGVNGYLNKNALPATFISAVQKILDGKNYFSEELLYSMLSGKQGKIGGRTKELSMKEFEVMHHLVKGMGISAIAKLMSLAPSTIATHKSRIFEKLGVSNVIDLSQYATSIENKN